jgi:crotonobetainyl-CoA:carnitine CoA-transferase CaiB-like acyl-CoA transferase
MTVQALTGIMARLGEPGEPPIYLGMGSGDAYGGIMSALGDRAALYQRNRTGHGQCIDASLYGAQLYLAAPQLQSYLAGNEGRALQHSRREALNPLWNLYPARGKWVYVCERNEDARFVLLAEAFGDPGLAKDPRFAERRGACAEQRRTDRCAGCTRGDTRSRATAGALAERGLVAAR